jgi:hypothetical protein
MVGIGGVTLGFGLGTQLAAFLGLGGMLAPVLGIVVAVIIDVVVRPRRLRIRCNGAAPSGSTIQQSLRCGDGPRALEW